MSYTQFCLCVKWILDYLIIALISLPNDLISITAYV